MAQTLSHSQELTRAAKENFGVNPEDYGMTKEQLRKIETVVLTKYVRLGNPLPSVELIKDYQAALFKIGNRRSTRHYRLYTKDQFQVLFEIIQV